MTAFFRVLSMRKTSAGQLNTQIPQPLHNCGLILSTAICTPQAQDKKLFGFKSFA